MVRTQNIDVQMLDDYIKKSGYKLDHIVKTLGISRQAFDNKRKGISGFRAPEVYVLCDLLKIPEDVKTQIFLP